MPRRDLTPYDDEPYEDEPEEESRALPEPRGVRVSDRSRGVALALSLVLGVFGAHRFYAGKVGTGIAMIVTVGGLGLWWLYDVILISTGEFRDAKDRVIRSWTTVRVPGLEAAKERRFEEFQDDLDALRREVGELAERLDFAERLLAKQRERDKLPGA